MFRRRGIAAEAGEGRPFEPRFQASKHSSGVDHFTSGSPCLVPEVEPGREVDEDVHVGARVTPAARPPAPRGARFGRRS